jgi:hypothetical protein
MADAVTSEYVFSGHKRKILHLTSVSDGTGESAVVKADISALTVDGGKTPTYSTVDMIDFAIQGFTAVRLYWDHDTDDEIALLPTGTGTIHFGAIGGKTDPKTSGGTGDIVLTTDGEVSGATYDIVIYFRPKV